MEENGIDLGVMNMLLLKKVEELTLYVIELKKTVGEMKVRDTELSQINQSLQKQIETLKFRIK